jgi:hypothetical protein
LKKASIVARMGGGICQTSVAASIRSVVIGEPRKTLVSSLVGLGLCMSVIR